MQSRRQILRSLEQVAERGLAAMVEASLFLGKSSPWRGNKNQVHLLSLLHDSATATASPVLLLISRLISGMASVGSCWGKNVAAVSKEDVYTLLFGNVFN